MTLLVGALQAQNLLPNPRLDHGVSGMPEPWRLASGQGRWTSETGVQLQGSGDDAGEWRSPEIVVRPGGLYRLAVVGRRAEGTGGGTGVAGTSRISRDFPLTPSDRRETFVFALARDTTREQVRLGQWHVRGTLGYREASLVTVQAAHGGDGTDLRLGEGESLRNGTYRFEPHFDWEGANYHRPLVSHRAGFNSNRWLFQPGAEVIYAHEIPGHRQTEARVRAGINHHTGGTLAIDASPDGTTWTALGQLDGQRRQGDWALPASFFPASRILIRLSQAGPGAGFQVDTFAYQARLGGAVPDVEGSTRFLDADLGSPDLDVGLDQLVAVRGAPGGYAISARLTQRTGVDKDLVVTWSDAEPGATGAVRRVILAPGTTERLRLEARPSRARRGTRTPEAEAGQGREPAAPDPEVGYRRLALAVAEAGSDRVLYRGVARVPWGFLDDDDGGTRLGAGGGVTVWACDSMVKVGRHRPPPEPGPAGNVARDPASGLGTASSRASRPRLSEDSPDLPQPALQRSPAPDDAGAKSVLVELARGEYEPVQIVLTPRRAARLESVALGAFRDGQGREVPGLESRWERVGYVAVTRPTDPTCVPGEYPDPLPPLRGPLVLRAGENQPLWLTVRALREAPAGRARTELRLRIDGEEVRVPLEVEVFGFALPRETHLRSALGLGSAEIRRYHRLSAKADEVAVFEKYLRNFAEHRISPYSFHDHAPIDVRFIEENGRKVARVDFTAFDTAAERWLGEDGFNTFQLPLRGMGGGTFHARHAGQLEGFAEGTPEHARLFRDYLGQVERHLRDRGWLGKAFTYWFDEPDPKDYAFVVEGMKRLRDAAPGIRRMLTEQPEPALFGHVDIWCGLTPEWTRETVRARRAAGEEVWWYICTAPKAPYVTEFIDHPGTELRLWPWQSWQYGVSGILVWATIYWNSPLAYPPPALQDPWQDPMSWVVGYGVPVGQRSPWGNGDGRFLYPPRGDGEGPILDGPVNSTRWENLRDGIEDYEYLWLLARETERLATAGKAPELVATAREALEIPASVSRDLTHFTTDPAPLRAHRRTVARLVERLQGIR